MAPEALRGDRDAVDAVILGGTELPLILHDDTPCGIPLLDTTQIHVSAAVAQLWSGDTAAR